MLIGVAREVINPEVGHHLCGYGSEYRNTGVHDDLSVTALYLNDGTRQALLLNFDLIGLMQSTVAKLQAAVAKAARAKPRDVFFACTHVHSAPEVIEKWVVGGWDSDNCRKQYMGASATGPSARPVRPRPTRRNASSATTSPMCRPT